MDAILSITLAAVGEGSSVLVTRLLIENGRIWQEDRFLRDHTLIVADGVVRALCPAAEVRMRPGDRRLDSRGAHVIPGFVDLHIHGSNNCDVMDATAASLSGLSAFLLRQGVTSFLGTTMTESPEKIEAALAAMRRCMEQPRSPLLGIHLEGPYLNPDFRGSQAEKHLRPPRREEYLPWFKAGHIKLITLAPELPGGEELMRDACAHGITVSVGHSGASYEAAQQYFARGATQITHTFNGMIGIHHRQPGLFIAAIERPETAFEVIADGVHVHPAVLRMLLRLVGGERLLAVTDAMRAAGLPDGRFALGDRRVTVRGGVSRSEDGRLAGSTLTMGQALKNLMRFCGLTLAEALPMVTRAPARAIGVYPQKGSLRIGADADMVLWDEELGARATIIGGALVEPAPDPCIAATADV